MEPAPPSPAAQSPPPSPSPPARRGDRALPLVLLVVAALAGAVLAALGTGNAENLPDAPGMASTKIPAAWTPAPRLTGETVSLTIDFGNGAERTFHALAWSEAMTLGDLMEQARDFRPGISFTQQGKGAMAMLTSLEGVANETVDRRYWLYSVDGRHGETSFAVQPLEAGAAVLWEFRRGE